MSRFIAPARRQRGVTLIEVLVAMVVVAVGLLGVAKMQALAVASSRTSSTRALVAIEAASLASMMHANETFWTSSAAQGLTVSVTGAAAFTATPSTSVATQSLVSPPCNAPSSCAGSAATMAGYDLTLWSSQLYTLIPTVTGATVACPTPASASTPLTCTVTISWNEQSTGIGSTASVATSPTAQSFALLVQP
jgi:type IV pilus assembly protein PilV